ncbi:MAG: S-methyl-5'-thioadenosine phosphorylase [Acidimicrobiales bacterium]|nr:S-methyl-5'-thioadenosine phosphorylase [Acidimicrobiales bacterium]MBO0892917.1 S-methyl-5'-thioadenosine phosphorylase [Acidimicrobiales bacterium]
MANRPRAEIGIIGGSGFYRFLDDIEEVDAHTPYGPAAGPLAVGRVGDRAVAFLARHGPRHHLPPHRVNYRANLWALRELGVRRVLAPAAAGSLRPDLHPGELVVCDQLVDRTWGRADTYFDGGSVGHVSFADPYCSALGRVLVSSATAPTVVHPRGTVVVIQGPRFSTRAESAWFRQAGWDLVNMTQYPEAVLARELGMCYSGLAIITDYDTGLEGVDGIEPVTMAAAFEVLRHSVDRVRQLLLDAIPAVPDDLACHCADALGSGPLRD